jgi:hypothetical protein
LRKEGEEEMKTAWKVVPLFICILVLAAALAWANEGKDAAAQSANPQVTIADMPASVVRTVPAAGSEYVDAKTTKEIRVTFSKDMMTERMWSICQISKETFPKIPGGIHYLKDKRTCVVPVELEPGKT